jgi:hypothetical protein
MNLSTLELPKEEAEIAFKRYSDAIKKRHSDEDAALAAGYKALSEGKSLISLPQVMREAGEDEKFLPKFAVARVTARWCWLDRRQDGSCRFSSVAIPSRQSRSVVTVPPDTYSRRTWGELNHQWGLRAMVPLVPPQHRPSNAPLMTAYHVLWEVDKWQKAPRPPGDPALIRHLRGDLWLLLATWDLSDLERAVLAERAL